MPVPVPAGETALGHWRLRATLLVPTLADDGAGGQEVLWTTGASFAAYAEPVMSTESMTLGRRTAAPLTVRTWFRRDVKAETDFGINARLQIVDGLSAPALYEISGTRPIAGPSGESLELALDLIGLSIDEAA